MTSHIIAINTYGSHRVKHPQTKQIISAYKMGYSSAASAVLLALYGDRAQDVSSKQASYHYIQVDAEVVVRHGYILIKITDEELRITETITRQVHYPAVYRWRGGAWLTFPNLEQADYLPVIGRSGPTFNPLGMRIVSASTGEVEAAIGGIIVEKSQRDPKKKPWWWVRGDTYPHRDLLKRWGCRWSKRQKAWYFIGQTLPEAVQNLIEELSNKVDNPSSEEGDPCSLEEATKMLGLTNKSPHPVEEESSDKSRLFSLGDTVYARHELETQDSKTIPTGTSGIIMQLYNRNNTHGWSYDVDFADVGTGWFFERELTSLEPIAGIRITRGHVIPQKAVSPLSDIAIKCSIIEHNLQPDPVKPDTPVVEIPKGVEDMSDNVPKVRVIKPVLDIYEGEEDAVITAICQTKAEDLPVIHSSFQSNTSKRTLTRITQSPCGELTGSISGSVWCYGYGIHEDTCIYLNMGGPRMAVEAIRAKLAKGDMVSCVPWDAPSIELTAGEGNTGMYSAFVQNIPEAKFTSLILCHELLTQPNYNGKSTSFIFHVSDEQAMAQLRHHITQLVKIPVFAEWTSYLWQAGQSAMLVRPTRTGGDIKLFTVVLDADAWTRLLTGGLATGIIHLSQNR